MKKILFLLLSTVAMYGQVPADATPLENIQITNNTTDNSATKVNVQSTDGTINTISKADLVNVVEVNDVPSLPLTGVADKIYVVKNVNKIYRWNGTFYQELAYTDISGLQAQIDLKAPISSVHNPVTLGTANGLSLSTQQLSLGLASSGVTGALSGTDWNNFNNKQNNLVSGANIKTIEGQSLLGSGNIDLVKADVGLSNVDNTSDANKPISIATQTALDSKAPVSGSANYIQNQNASAQSANMWINGRIAWGNSVDNSYLESSSANGTNFVGKTGSTNDFVFHNGLGQGVIENPTGTQNVVFKGSSTFGGRVLVNKTDDDLTNQLQVAGTISASPATTANQVVVKSQLDAFVPSGTVNLTGAQTVLGVKTFSSSPIVPTAVNANEAVNKGQLDAVAASSGRYTPTGNVITGAASVSAQSHTYIKIGNIVTVYGESLPTSVATSVPVIYEISLPIARANTVTKALGFGTMNVPGGSTIQTVRLESSSATTVRISFNINAAGTPSVLYSFQYDITQ